MLNNLNKNIKSITKHLPINLFTFNSKTLIYFGLSAYWGVILLGTFLNFKKVIFLLINQLVDIDILEE